MTLEDGDRVALGTICHFLPPGRHLLIPSYSRSGDIAQNCENPRSALPKCWRGLGPWSLAKPSSPYLQTYVSIPLT